jgi:hypothetical protein
VRHVHIDDVNDIRVIQGSRGTGFAHEAPPSAGIGS